MRIGVHQDDWGRWETSEINVYLGRIAGLASITNEEWRGLIDRVEAVLIYKIAPPYNASRIKSFQYSHEPILIVNHGRRHRLPECMSNITEFINTDNSEFKTFGPSGREVI